MPPKHPCSPAQPGPAWAGWAVVVLAAAAGGGVDLVDAGQGRPARRSWLHGRRGERRRSARAGEDGPAAASKVPRRRKRRGAHPRAHADRQAACPAPPAGRCRRPQALQHLQVNRPGRPARDDHPHPRLRLRCRREVAPQHQRGEVRARRAAGCALPALHRHRALGAGHEREEAVQGLQRDPAAARADAEVVGAAVGEAGGGEGGALGVGSGGRRGLVEGDDGGGAEVGEEGGAEVGGEEAAARHVRVAVRADGGGRGGDGGIVGGLEEEDLARDEVEDPAVDRAAEERNRN